MRAPGHGVHVVPELVGMLGACEPLAGDICVSSSRTDRSRVMRRAMSRAASLPRAASATRGAPDAPGLSVHVAVDSGAGTETGADTAGCGAAGYQSLRQTSQSLTRPSVASSSGATSLAEQAWALFDKDLEVGLLGKPSASCDMNHVT